MKILYDNQIFQLQKFGGISRYFHEIMKMPSALAEVEILETLVKRPVPIQNKDVVSRGIRYITRKIRQPVSYPEFQYKDAFKETTFDVFHPTYYSPYFLDFTKKPFVLTIYDMIHEIYSEYFDHTASISSDKRLLCKEANQIITISETTKRDLIDIFKLPEEKIHAIPLASNFKEIDAQRPAGSDRLRNYILFVGLRSGYKNFHFSTIALSDLLRQDKDLQLVCTGHEFSKSEMDFFKSLEIDHQVVHVYLKDDKELAWVYQNAKVFIFPSLYEGFGLPLLEAFARGCPVISSKNGSLQEVGGDSVLYFDPKNILEIQDAAFKGIYDHGVRATLVEKGHERLKAFSWDKCRGATTEVYKMAAG